MKCKWHSGCDNDARTRGWCTPHYGKLLRAGQIEAGVINATAVQRHIAEFVARGGNCAILGRRAGLDRKTARWILDGTSSQVRVSTAKKVLSTPLPPTAVGVIRRLRALSRIGWPHETVSERAGIAYRTLDSQLTRRWFSIRAGEAVAATYEALSTRQGPSQLAVRRAIAKDWPAPAAWDYIDIDDPVAEPELGGPLDDDPFDEVDVYEIMAGHRKVDTSKREKRLRAARDEAIRRFGTRHTVEWIAERVGCTERTVYRVRAETMDIEVPTAPVVIPWEQLLVVARDITAQLGTDVSYRQLNDRLRLAGHPCGSRRIVRLLEILKLEQLQKADDQSQHVA